MLEWTMHARLRCAQRAVRDEAIEATLAWGKEYRIGRGRTVWFLGYRQVEHAAAEGVDARSFEGTALVVADDGALVTAIRTPSTLRFRPRRRRPSWSAFGGRQRVA